MCYLVHVRYMCTTTDMHRLMNVNFLMEINIFFLQAEETIQSYIKVFIFQNDTQMFTSVISLLTVTQHMFKHHWYKNVLKHVFIKGNVDFYGQHGWIRGSYMYLNNFNTT